MPRRYLAKAEVEGDRPPARNRKLHRLSDGHDITWDMREGGRLFGRNLTQNTGDNATWSVNDKGELCVKWRGNSNDGCLAVARDGDAYKTYEPSATRETLSHARRRVAPVSSGAPLAMPSSFIAPATAATASSSRSGPIAPMQPTRKVSTWVSLPG